MRGVRRIPVALALLFALLLSGCGLGTAGGFSPTGKLAGPLAEVPPLNGVTVKVGSKNFTEQLLLGKIAVILFQSAGADVQDLTNIPGSSSARQAQLQGQSTFQWEYTGTAWISYLGHEQPIPDERGQYEAVRDEDKRLHNQVWLEPAPMNNTYSFALKRQRAEQLGVRAMSDLAKLPPEELTFCLESEFANRNDGFEPWLQTYGLTNPPAEQKKILATGAIYEATAQGLCNFGEVFTTDGRIKALDLVVLEDDKQYFPKYNVAGVVHGDLAAQAPQLPGLVGPVAERLDNDTLIDLNARVDVGGEEPTDVAWDWLRDEGLVQE